MDKHEHKTSLMSDADLVALMDAEYRAHGQDLSAAAKARGFAQLAAALPAQDPASTRSSAPPRRLWSLWSGPLAMAALLAIGLAPILLRPTDEPSPDRGSKGVGAAAALAVQLEGFVLGDGGELRRSDGAVAGDVVVFKAQTPVAAAVALVVRANGAPARVAFVGRLDGGSPQLVERGGETFGLRLEEPLVAMQICAIAAVQETSLEALTASPTELPASACVSIGPPHAD